MIAIVALIATACGNKAPEPVQEEQPTAKLSDKYAEYTLTTDISHLKCSNI